MRALLFTTIFLFIAPVFVHAVNINYTPLAPIPGTGNTICDSGIPNPNCKVANLGGYLRGIYMTGIALAGLFVVFSIVRGGFTLLFTDSILGKSEGKSMILHALGGLLIVFSSFVLMNTINPQLGRDLDLNLSFPAKNITSFVSTVKPLTQAELDVLTLKNENTLSAKRGNLAGASRAASDVMDTAVRNSRATADTLDGQAKVIESKTDATAEERQEAIDLRKRAEELRDAADEIAINSLATKTAAVANSYYARGSVAAQNAMDGFGVKTEEYGKAETELTLINRWFENGINALKPYGGKSSGEIAALLDHQILQASTIQQNLAKADINVRGESTNPNFVKAVSRMTAISEQAKKSIADITALPTPTTNEDRALLTSKKENIRRLANGMLNNLKSDCAAMTSTRTQNVVPCKDFALIP